MKSKVREISVDACVYVWGVTERDWHTIRLKVWVKGKKHVPWFVVEKKFHDPWINFSELSKGTLKSDEECSTPITPGLVAAYIKEVKKQKFESAGNTPIFLKTKSDGGLEINEDGAL